LLLVVAQPLACTSFLTRIALFECPRRFPSSPSF
jgi:hypothetical protein